MGGFWLWEEVEPSSERKSEGKRKDGEDRRRILELTRSRPVLPDISDIPRIHPFRSAKRFDKDIHDLAPEELAKAPSMPGALDEALEALERDHQFLLNAIRRSARPWCFLSSPGQDPSTVGECDV